MGRQSLCPRLSQPVADGDLATNWAFSRAVPGLRMGVTLQLYFVAVAVGVTYAVGTCYGPLTVPAAEPRLWRDPLRDAMYLTNDSKPQICFTSPKARNFFLAAWLGVLLSTELAFAQSDGAASIDFDIPVQSLALALDAYSVATGIVAVYNGNLEHVVFFRNRDSQLGGFLIQTPCWERGPAWMTRPYSEDIRERALVRSDAGETVRAIAEALQISPSCVTKWKNLRRETGGLSPGKI